MQLNNKKRNTTSQKWVTPILESVPRSIRTEQRTAKDRTVPVFCCTLFLRAAANPIPRTRRLQNRRKCGMHLRKRLRLH